MERQLLRGLLRAQKIHGYRTGGCEQVHLAADRRLTLLRAELAGLDNLLERLNKDT